MNMYPSNYFINNIQDHTMKSNRRAYFRNEIYCIKGFEPDAHIIEETFLRYFDQFMLIFGVFRDFRLWF